MTVATLTRAQFLKADERTDVETDATLTARWGDAAGDTTQSSVLVAAGDATAECSRQLALLGYTLAEDAVTVEGLFFDLEGETVDVAYTAPSGIYFGGAASVTMLVVKASPDLGQGTTTIQGYIRL